MTRRHPVWLMALTLIAIGLFLALGIWQLERRSWKLDLIAHVDAQIHQQAMPAPAPTEWPQLNVHDAYRHVTLRGVFLNDKETYVQASTVKGPGYWVLTPLKTDVGFTVLINRGFVPPEKRDPSTRAQGQITGKSTITGLLRITEPKGRLLRTNDPAHERWYSRDVTAIAARRDLSNTAPYFIDADATPNAGGWPLGGLTVVSFYNEHLVYAISWFAMALTLTICAGAAFGLRPRTSLRAINRQRS